MVLGVTVSDPELRKMSALQQAIFRRAEELLVGKNAVPIQRIKNLDIRLAIPKAAYIEAKKAAEGATVDYETLEWFHANFSMEKYQCRIRVTDEAVARNTLANQLRLGIDAAAKGLQIAKDKEIFNSLVSGAGQSVAAAAAWNSDTAKPEDDIAEAIQKITDNTVITDADLKNMNLFVPAGLMGFLKKRVEIANMQVPMEQALREEFGIGIFYTRHLSDVALLVVKSNETAIHFEYAGADVKTTEQTRVPGVGTDYIITQYFKTVVIPDEEGKTTSSRICKITGVKA